MKELSLKVCLAFESAEMWIWGPQATDIPSDHPSLSVAEVVVSFALRRTGQGSFAFGAGVGTGVRPYSWKWMVQGWHDKPLLMSSDGQDSRHSLKRLASEEEMRRSLSRVERLVQPQTVEFFVHVPWPNLTND